MSDITYQLAEYIANNLSYTMGVDMHVGQQPHDIDKGVLIMRMGGTMEMYTPMVRSYFDISYKDTSASTAIDKLEAIKRFIHRMIDTETDNFKIYSILVIEDIADRDRDLESNKRFGFTVEVHHRSTGLIS